VYVCLFVVEWQAVMRAESNVNTTAVVQAHYTRLYTGCSAAPAETWLRAEEL